MHEVNFILGHPVAVNQQKKVVNIEKIMSDVQKPKRGGKLEVCPEFTQFEQGPQGAGEDIDGNSNAVSKYGIDYHSREN